MASGKHVPDSAAYRPTSLDFINHPNPIEPHAQIQKHPLNGTPRLENARLEANPSTVSGHDIFDLILEPSAERPAKRKKVADNNVLDLPRPTVRNQAKRLRIPPTLSGLHQPPPDARLLPSINVDKPHAPILPQKENIPDSARSDQVIAEKGAPTPATKEDRSVEKPTKSRTKRLKRHRWTERETEDLLKGVAKFGIGKWTKILVCPDYDFGKRTAMDLKDRFRVYCPNDYKNGRTRDAGKRASMEVVEKVSVQPIKPAEHCDDNLAEKNTTKARRTRVVDSAPHRVTNSKLKSLGIDEPFAKAERRPRHGYTTEEDQAILKGFRKHGNSWVSIRSDPILGLSHRKATDLRDRMRTKFTEEFAKAGLTPRPDKAAEVAQKDGSPPVNQATEQTLAPRYAPHEHAQQSTAVSAPTTHSTTTATKLPPSTLLHDRQRHMQPFHYTLDDIFLGTPSSFNDDYDYTEPDASSEPIVLDRGILDWATADAARTNAATTANADSVRDGASVREIVTNSGGIDPLMTLVLPRPHGLRPATIVQSTHSSYNTNPNTTTSLPSLADLLPMDYTNGSTSSEQVELPSLMPWYNNTLSEDRGTTTAGGVNLTLEELLS
ncbi:hypothetical protein TI39_contig369g00018 [Zymoseptoria brevis]|uniref:MYB DNA-binding domain containing protein n=1 Tax=Zymoseptoria brevis TaxID=1047168 RepID=A0A0F4GPM8_9PEZI|nr:hypothetical protein TI39_contig369g00018 [Zymoseptoria brevis]